MKSKVIIYTVIFVLLSLLDNSLQLSTNLQNKFLSQRLSDDLFMDYSHLAESMVTNSGYIICNFRKVKVIL